MHDEAINRQTLKIHTLKIHHIISGLPVAMRQNNRESDPENNQQIYQEEKNVISCWNELLGHLTLLKGEWPLYLLQAGHARSHWKVKVWSLSRSK